MKKFATFVVPMLALVVMVWGCSQVDSSRSNDTNKVVAPVDLGGGMGGHHGDDCGCMADSCTCPNHDDCGGMMGGGNCDPDCPGDCGHMGDGGCDSSGHGGGGGGCDSSMHGGHHHGGGKQHSNQN